MSGTSILPAKPGYRHEAFELAGDACLRAALKSSSVIETLQYAQKSATAYIRAALETNPQGREPLVRKIRTAENLEARMSVHLLHGGTEAADTLYILTHPEDDEHSESLRLQMRKRKQTRATPTILSEILHEYDGEDAREEVTMLAQAAIQASGDASYEFETLSRTRFNREGYLRALWLSLRLLDKLVPQYSRMAMELPVAAEAVQNLFGKSPEEFIKMRDGIILNLANA